MIKLFSLSDLPCPSTKEIDVNGTKGFVVRTDQGIRAYVNQCPHTGAPLNWQPDQFFDLDNQHIQCALHMALFEPLSGKCVWGPCQGDALTEIAISVVDETLFALPS
jgi:nitrite reductase/ring-hydroxylating ferredoxin subunit